MTVYRRSYIFRLASDPVARLWTGWGALDTPADAVDPAGARWIGAAGILALPALKALINGTAERVRFSLSGVSEETVRLATEDRATVRGAELRLGYVDFDQRWQLTGPIRWEWLGVADVITVESAASGRGRTRTISLSVASADTLRSNPNFAFYTDADQRKRSPTDAFCNQVANISLGMTRRFGPR